MTGKLQNIALQINEMTKILTPPDLLHNPNFWNMFVLAITLGVLIWYTVETHKLATQARDANLRPVILRSGPTNWNALGSIVTDNQIKVRIFEFTVSKNIATSINGHVIINKKKYELGFTNEISKIDDEKGYIQEAGKYEKQRGWMNANTKIYAIFKEDNGLDIESSNQIIIQYEDIEGNPYYTIENEKFDQISRKGFPTSII